MSDIKPDGPYVYQPFGMKEREHWNAKRIYAVGGMDRLATLTGLTEGEAYSVVDALRGTTRLARVEAENVRLREALEGVRDEIATCPKCGWIAQRLLETFKEPA